MTGINLIFLFSSKIYLFIIIKKLQILFLVLNIFYNLTNPTTTMAEFPDVGKHCSVIECKQLDFLPITCDACSLIFCKLHKAYVAHGCAGAYKKEMRFPICPLCQQAVPIKRGELPDKQVNEHIERNCQSDLAKKGRMAPKCGVRNCFKRELVQMECKNCLNHFCIGHRHPTDHHCTRTKDLKTANLTDKAKEQRKNVEMDELYAQQLQKEEYERYSPDSSGQGRQQNGNCNVM